MLWWYPRLEYRIGADLLGRRFAARPKCRYQQMILSLRHTFGYPVDNIGGQWNFSRYPVKQRLFIINVLFVPQPRSRGRGAAWERGWFPTWGTNCQMELSFQKVTCAYVWVIFTVQPPPFVYKLTQNAFGLKLFWNKTRLAQALLSLQQEH